MNEAQKFIAFLLGAPVDDATDLRLAARQTGNPTERYKAPHAMRGTHPRPRRRKPHGPRLFTGHRD